MYIKQPMYLFFIWRLDLMIIMINSYFSVCRKMERKRKLALSWRRGCKPRPPRPRKG
jgi:hypothetical protein